MAADVQAVRARVETRDERPMGPAERAYKEFVGPNGSKVIIGSPDWKKAVALRRAWAIEAGVIRA